MGNHFLLQGLFLTQGSNLCLLHWQADSLPLCYLGILKLCIIWLITEKLVTLDLKQGSSYILYSYPLSLQCKQNNPYEMDFQSSQSSYYFNLIFPPSPPSVFILPGANIAYWEIHLDFLSHLAILNVLIFFYLSWGSDEGGHLAQLATDMEAEGDCAYTCCWWCVGWSESREKFLNWFWVGKM